jgi:Predicted oxidoreductase
MTVSRTRMSAQGPEVSKLIAGYWRLKNWGMTPQQVLGFIEQSLEMGITTADHAMVYNSEQPFGEALALDSAIREKLEIVTKCGIRPCGFGELGAKAVNHYDSSAAAIQQSVDASLTKLGTEYIDVLLIHRPDFLMNANEVAEKFLQLKQAGKVRYFGVSNFTTDQFELLQKAVKALIPEGLVTNQIEFSPLYMEPLENGLLDQCARHGVAPMLWSCLGGGRLMTPNDERSQRLHDALRIVADECNLSDIEPVVYAWALTLPGNALPLLGTSKIERVKVAVQAANLTLNREQWYRIWEASTGHAVP